jgi:hypothetical protein
MRHASAQIWVIALILLLPMAGLAQEPTDSPEETIEPIEAAVSAGRRLAAQSDWC